jgi:hypothetical protein
MEVPVHPDTRSRLFAARTALVLGPVIAGISVILQPDLDGSPASRLAAMDGSRAAVSAVTFLVSQLPLLIGILAIGRLLLPRAPKLSAWGTALGVVGCFGHTVFGGTSMVYLLMARDESHRAVQAALFDRIQSSPVMIFSAIGLLGTVLGMLLLGIGLYRSRTVPVWVGPTIWAFLVVEFVGTAFSTYASFLSVLLLGAAFVAIAGVLGSSSTDSAARTPAAVTARSGTE